MKKFLLLLFIKKDFNIILKEGCLMNKESIEQSRKLTRKVVQLLVNLNKDYDIFSIKTDLENFIENFDIKVYYSNMDGFDNPNSISGYSIVNDSGQPEIVINANDSKRRQRFTMAHEFGHIIMHWDWLNNKNGLNKDNTEILFRSNNYNNNLNDLKEFQANEFAAELLLPHNHLKEGLSDLDLLKENPLAMEKMKKMVSEAFNVSEPFAYTQIRKIIDEETEIE